MPASALPTAGPPLHPLHGAVPPGAQRGQALRRALPADHRPRGDGGHSQQVPHGRLPGLPAVLEGLRGARPPADRGHPRERCGRAGGPEPGARGSHLRLVLPQPTSTQPHRGDAAEKRGRGKNSPTGLACIYLGLCRRGGFFSRCGGRRLPSSGGARASQGGGFSREAWAPPHRFSR